MADGKEGLMQSQKKEKPQNEMGILGLKLECLKLAVSLRVNNELEVIESKADHFFHWLMKEKQE